LNKRSKKLLLILVWWHWLGVRNGVRAAWGNNRRELVLVVAGVAFLMVYNLASIYSSLMDVAPIVRSAWHRILLAEMAATMMIGATCGRLCGRWAGRQISAAWLAVLPWPPAERLRAARLACFTVGGVLTPLPAFCGWGVGHAVAAPHQAIATAALGLGFMVAFLTASLPGAGRNIVADADDVAEPAQPRVAVVWRLVERLDRMAPRWAGVWAQGDHGRFISRWWLANLLAAGGAAGAITLTQGWIWPSVVISVVGGNLAYMMALVGAPLLSPVLRSSPVQYGVAWGAMARAPLALSLLWSGVAAVPALIVSGAAWRQALGGLGVLMTLNLLFSVAVAAVPSSRRQAAMLYVCLLCVIIYQGLEYGMAYGALAGVAVLGVAGLLWRQARRRFRGHA